MAIERRLTEIVGRVGGKIHTGRSRNDQVATDLAMFVADRAAVARELLDDCLRADPRARRRAPRRAAARLHPPAAGPAGLARPSPARLVLDAPPRRRPLRRGAVRRPAAMPLGSGRPGGPQLGARPRARSPPSSASTERRRELDRRRRRTATSRSTTSSAAATCATHLSRIGAEIVLWSTSEFGFCRPAEEFSSGSSIMPQKMNPDAAELLRAKAPRVVAGADDADRRHARPAARLQQGPPGGQGAAVRRRRHDRAQPPRARRDARPGSPSTTSGWPRPPPTRWPRRPTSPTCSSAAGCRSARRTASSAASSATRSTPGIAALGDPARGARRASRSCSTTSTTRCSARARWLDSKVSRGGTSAAAVAEQLEARRGEPRRPRLMGAEPAPLDREFFDRAAARGRRRADRLHAAARRRAAGRSSRPRPTSATIPPATPTADRPRRNAPLFGPPGPRLRLPLLRDPLDVQPRHRARGHGGRRPDPRARADRGHRADAGAPRPSSPTAISARARARSARRSAIELAPDGVPTRSREPFRAARPRRDRASARSSPARGSG